ncbi:ribonuclease P protein component [Bryocella elongata]|uniref:Ribonuclease P protein component n=1 Tax=Bryocella elongata TaxID=863522 RepID=A0A1H5Y310_9BACT|nr:ribonuclease P protein component [Bryocella elongata]SEG18361.1 ribonuclease P protein component [Bryocella elongata]
MDHRLCQHADYQRVYKTSRKQFGKQIAYFHVLRGVPVAGREVARGPRVGLTVPKALGKAVDRNRIKRRLRECVRGALSLLTSDVDVILHPRRSVLTTEFAGLEREVAMIFRSVQAACDRTKNAANRAGSEVEPAQRVPAVQQP